MIINVLVMYSLLLSTVSVLIGDIIRVLKIAETRGFSGVPREPHIPCDICPAVKNAFIYNFRFIFMQLSISPMGLGLM